MSRVYVCKLQSQLQQVTAYSMSGLMSVNHSLKTMSRSYVCKLQTQLQQVTACSMPRAYVCKLQSQLQQVTACSMPRAYVCKLQSYLQHVTACSMTRTKVSLPLSVSSIYLHCVEDRLHFERKHGLVCALSSG